MISFPLLFLFLLPSPSPSLSPSLSFSFSFSFPFSFSFSFPRLLFLLPSLTFSFPLQLFLLPSPSPSHSPSLSFSFSFSFFLFHPFLQMFLFLRDSGTQVLKYFDKTKQFLPISVCSKHNVVISFSLSYLLNKMKP